MKTANLNRLPNRSANLSRTGHDMSQEFTFTASTGMILPTYQDYLNAGETEYYSGDLICRTQPLVTAAMCDVDLYLDWFFVPAQMLFTLFGSKRWMTNDLLSSFYDDSVIDNDTMPLFNIDSYLAVANADLAKPVVNYYDANYSLEFECLGKSQFRLANHLGFNPYGIFKGNSSAATTYVTEDNPNVFPLFALAYQAIYQDYFRLPLDSFERRNIKAFNVDSDYTATSTPVSYTALSSKAQLFCLRYRPRHLDYFTSIKASPMYSAMNQLGAANAATILDKVDSYLSGSTVRMVSNTDGQQHPSAGTANNNGVASGTSVPATTNTAPNLAGGLSTARLRSLFAVEKLQRVIGRAKSDYDSQVLAHFGFKVPHDVKHQLSHLKTQHSIIHIGEVISTADTYTSGSGGSSGSALGAIGGKGYGIIKSGDKPFKFTAPCDGVIMCTFSAVPRLRYYGTFDKQNVLTNRLSFYQPEFDKLGMQPIYHYEAFHFRSADSDNSNRLGWQFRYEQWKRKYDKVSEAFALPSNYGQLNQNSAWVVSLSPYATVNSLSGSSYGVGWSNAGLVCKPTELNSAMVVPYTTQWNTAYLTNPQTMFYTDPFICQFRANVKKVSVMSAYGEPDLGTI